MREEKGGSQPRGEKHPPPLRNSKLCILPSFLLVFQQTCKAKHFFLGCKDTETFRFQEL